MLRLRLLGSPVALGMAGLLVLAVAVRLPFFRFGAYMSLDPVMLDAWIWQFWARDLWRDGLDDVSNLTPKTAVGFHYVLWGVGQVYGLMSPDFEVPSMRLHYLLKGPLVLFDLLLVPLIFVATRRAARLLSDGFAAASAWPPVRALAARGLAPVDALGLAAAAMFVLSPGVIYDSAVWAQYESIISFFMLAAVLLLASGRVAPAWAAWAIGFVIKPQPVVILPALAAFTYWRFGAGAVARGAASAAAAAFAMLSYFIATGNGPYIIDVYQELFKTHDTYISINAWNVWWIGQLHGLRASDTLLSVGPLSLTVEGLSFLLLVVSTAAVLAYLYARRDVVGLLVSCAMLEFAFYLFPISTHERYLYPLFVFLAPVLFLQPSWLALYLPLAGVFFVNVFFASPTDPDIFGTYLESAFGQAMSVLNVLAFAVTLAVLLVSGARTGAWPRPLRPAARAASAPHVDALPHLG